MHYKNKIMTHLQKTQMFLPSSGTKNDQTSSACPRRWLPTGPTRLTWFIWRCARGLGMGLLLYAVWRRCPGPESVPELERSQPSCSAPDCGSESVPDSDGDGGVTKEGNCDNSEDTEQCDWADVGDTPGSRSNVTRRVGGVMVGKAWGWLVQLTFYQSKL